MQKGYDAIIIGAGVIGAAIGFELAKRGHKTLNIDKLPGSGQGSTQRFVNRPVYRNRAVMLIE